MKKVAGKTIGPAIDKKTVVWFSVFSGALCGILLKKNMASQTADWVASGQPLLDRWLDNQLWFAIGFAVGALLGACLAAAWLKAGTRKHRRR